MKQNPSKLKYRKNHKVAISFLKLKEQKNFFLRNGFFALKASESGKLTRLEIEACRKSIRRSLRKSGTVYMRTFTGFSVTSKGLGARMGTGKGSHSF